ncbi:hypothetical protein QN375_00715 [Pseudomonas sp. MH9.2]|uniref:hypothetical protein n=1 Tax=unclassified Pseudomonas TaxID=196821 RepID=UPI002AC941CE|nr:MULTISPECIES: hypothetical protein [unclassified Pseudomonas]MEB0005270.1 hypothetical protein [Pseudomonas sp. RTB2]MEB0015467.1 hypothetical protein [Pseudomonas sp. RTB3]MEB0024320.1 hypothetical protein [Pseudomonas sp. MH9.2]MEB0149512.1 hypothetical protein [Pseudomonas sp. CCC2.2]MEB0270513.1 hypothetical protein [Pseudomonas sp. 5B4]
MNNKINALLISLLLCQFSGSSFAEPVASIGAAPMCFRNNGTIYESIANAGEYKVVHGPFTTKCGTTAHSIQLRSVAGERLPVVVEQLSGGDWTRVVNGAFDPYQKLGNGTFRVILDNQQGQTPVRYKGIFSVPL